MGNGCLHQFRKSWAKKTSEILNSEFLTMTVVGESVDRLVQAELTYTIFANTPVQHFQCWQLVHRHHTALVFHEAS